MKKRKKRGADNSEPEIRFFDEGETAEDAPAVPENADAAEDAPRVPEDAAVEEDIAVEETAEDILRTVVDDGEYYTVPMENGNLLWSAVSVLFAVFSVVLFAFFYIGAIISAVIAIIFSLIASRKLSFFDRMALFGLIFGIFGLVFGGFSMLIDLTGVLDGFIG